MRTKVAGVSYTQSTRIETLALPIFGQRIHPTFTQKRGRYAHVQFAATIERSLEPHTAGKIIEAMNEFYDKDTVMQDNANPPTKGLAANIEREKQFMSGVKEWKGFNVSASGVGDNVTFYESTNDFVATGGMPVHLE